MREHVRAVGKGMLAVRKNLPKILKNNHLSGRIQPEEPNFRDGNWHRRWGSNGVRADPADAGETDCRRQPRRGGGEAEINPTGRSGNQWQTLQAEFAENTGAAEINPTGGAIYARC